MPYLTIDTNADVAVTDYGGFDFFHVFRFFLYLVFCL